MRRNYMKKNIKIPRRSFRECLKAGQTVRQVENVHMVLEKTDKRNQVKEETKAEEGRQGPGFLGQ